MPYIQIVLRHGVGFLEAQSLHTYLCLPRSDQYLSCSAGHTHFARTNTKNIVIPRFAPLVARTSLGPIMRLFVANSLRTLLGPAYKWGFFCYFSVRKLAMHANKSGKSRVREKYCAKLRRVTVENSSKFSFLWNPETKYSFI